MKLQWDLHNHLYADFINEIKGKDKHFENLIKNKNAPIIGQT